MDNVASIQLLLLVLINFFAPLALWCLYDGIKNRRAKK